MVNRIEKENAVTQQLRIIYKAIQAHSKRVETLCGLSSVRLWMLHEINNAPGIKVSQLATILAIHRSTCSNMLDKLEDQQLIIRNRSKTDQRAVHLNITDKGKKILETAPAPPNGELSSSLSNLSQKQLDDLEGTLTILVDALQHKDDKAALTPIQTP